MNILITGGCGFIGVNLIKALLNRGDERVLVVDDLSVGTLEDLAQVTEFQEIGTSGLEGKELRATVSFIKGDIRDGELAVKACRGMDAVVHLAANTGVIPSIEDPRADCEANVIGTFNYLEACRVNPSTISRTYGAGGVKRFVFASSGAPLGEQEPPIHEEMVPRPISPYGASKLAGEAYCSAYHGSYGLDTVVLRFGNVYGPYSTHKGSVVAKFIKQALAGETLVIYGDGSQTRDFIYVDDLIKAIMSTSYTDIGGEIFQIATHKGTTINEIAEKLKTIIESKTGNVVNLTYARPRAGEVKRNFSDISKAQRILDWEPKWSVEEGLKATVEWFMSA